MKTNDDNRKRQLEALLSRIRPLGEEEIEYLRKQFYRALKAHGKSQADWLRDNDMESKASLLSNVLAGRTTSAPILEKVIEYTKNNL